MVAWVVGGADDDSVSVAARLMERGIRVRVAEKAFELGETEFPRGSLVVLPADNSGFDGDLGGAVSSTTSELALEATPVATGLGEGDLPDLGGGYFMLLEPPRIALAARSGYSFNDYGSIWHTLDHRIGIRHSQLEGEFLDFADLRRYNVLVLPDRWFGTLSERSVGALKTWVEAGGTLVAIGESARELTSETSEISQVRQLESVLGALDEYELSVQRQWMAAQHETPSPSTVWSHTAQGEIDYPWSHGVESPRPAKEELERRDRWQRPFMPQGAFLASRVDQEHWLTFGTAEILPVLFGSSQVLMAGESIEAPVRFGVLAPNPQATGGRVGWGPVPPGHDLHLRMSGLLWPEAAQRLANAPFVTRERKGNGQVILFASPPTYRAATLGTMRVLLNAMIYGPGFGARHPIQP